MHNGTTPPEVEIMPSKIHVSEAMSCGGGTNILTLSGKTQKMIDTVR